MSDSKKLQTDAERAIVNAVRSVVGKGHNPGQTLLEMLGSLAYSLGCTVSANDVSDKDVEEIFDVARKFVDDQFKLGLERGAEGGQLM